MDSVKELLAQPTPLRFDGLLFFHEGSQTVPKFLDVTIQVIHYSVLFVHFHFKSVSH